VRDFKKCNINKMQQRGYQIVENIKKMQYKMALD
jgi:hypothetical protein